MSASGVGLRPTLRRSIGTEFPTDEAPNAGSQRLCSSFGVTIRLDKGAGSSAIRQVGRVQRVLNVPTVLANEAPSELAQISPKR